MFFKKNLFVSLIWLSISTVFFSACEKTDDQPDFPDTYTDGIFILNQGNFGKANASVSFYNPATKTVTADLFGQTNNRPIGDILQSMTVFEEKAYLVVNNSDKIEIVDEKSFQSLGTITGLAQPRYMLIKDENTAFVSQWGNGVIPAGVAVVNLKNNSIEKIIETGEGPEKMLLAEGKLYVCNSGGLAFDETVAIVDLATETISKKIKISDGPSQIVYAEGSVWVLCSGVYDPVLGDFTAGALAKLNADTLTGKISISGFPQNLVLWEKNLIRQKELYFTTYLGLFKATLPAGVILPGVPVPEKVSDNVYSGLGVDPETGLIYAGDPKDYQSDGEVYILGENNLPVDSFSGGLIPAFFWKQ